MADNSNSNHKQKGIQKSLLQLITNKYPQQKREDSKNQIVVLSNGEGLFAKQSIQKILQNERINVKMVGINSSSKNISEFVSEPYLIDKYSCAYSIKNKIVKVNEEASNQQGLELIQRLYKNQVYLAYQYLIKEKALFLVDGHKFGGDFLAYQFNPDSNHAVFLIFVSYANKQIQQQQISRAAGICKKSILLVNVKISQNDVTQINCTQIQPRVIIQNKKPQQTSSCTEDLLKLKRMLGYNV